MKGQMNTLRQALSRPARTQKERDVQAAIRSVWDREGKPPLTREAKRHVTVSAMVVNPAMDKILMVRHNLYNAYTWPGGHADGEEDLLAAALREVREETGAERVYPLCSTPLAFDILPVPAHEKRGRPVAAHEHYNVTYACLAPDRQPLRVKADENSAMAWIAADKMEEMCQEAHMLPLYKKCYERIHSLMQEKEARCGLLPDVLLPWYDGAARDLPWRKDRNPYHVWLSEIMLQQTRVEAVKGYYERFLAELPTIEKLASVPQERLLKLWEGLGYYTRAKNLQKAAQTVVREYDGRFPQEYEAIARLPGVGPYTAGAIASICFEQPEPAVDGNVLRVLARILEVFAPVDTPAVKKQATEWLRRVYPRGKCGAFTQSLMELGATVCLPNGQPRCESCPAHGFCMAYENGTVEELPRRSPKRERRIEKRTVLILLHEGRVALRRRGEGGLLGGLWEFPNMEGELDENEALQTAADWGTEPYELIKRVGKKHIFTHVEWHMTGYYIRCRRAAEPFTWAGPQQLEGEIALPTAFAIFKDEIKY